MWRMLVVLALWLSPGRPAGAQASVHGTVFDSLLTDAPLDGATVIARGSTRTAQTDRRGRFTLEGLAPGRYAFSFFHPSLDSLGIGAPVLLVDLDAGASREVALATPSANTLSQRLCGRPAETSTGMLFGTVHDAERGEPIGGAEVFVRWFEVEIGAGGARQQERRALDATRADGRFLLCGVPNDIALTLTATHAGQSTGPLHLEMDARALDRRELRISLTDPASRVIADAPDDTADVGRVAGLGRLSVIVRASTGAPTPRAIVGIRGTTIHEVTDDSGRAVLRGIPSGSQTVVVRAIGLQPGYRQVALTPGAPERLEVSLTRFALLLPSVAVVGQRPDPLIEDIRRRVRGGRGRLVDGDQLLELAQSSSAWARIPGITVGANADGDAMPLMRGAAGGRCEPTVWADGVRLADARGWELRGLLLNARRVEVYTTPARVPTEFVVSSLDPCGAVLIWSR